MTKIIIVDKIFIQIIDDIDKIFSIAINIWNMKKGNIF